METATNGEERGFDGDAKAAGLEAPEQVRLELVANAAPAAGVLATRDQVIDYAQGPADHMGG